MGTDNEKVLPSGLPDMTGKKGGPPILLAAFLVVPVAIGFAIANGIYKYGSTDKYDKKIAGIVAEEAHWLYLAAVVFGRLVAIINMIPMVWKDRVMTMKSGNLRANMYVYKAIGDKAGENAVVLEDSGDLGGYNRANRSLHHMVENMGLFVVALALAGAVFPFPVFVLTCMFAIGRVMHQVGYTTGYGGHGMGFMISNMIASNALEGLCLLVALKGFGISVV